MKIRAFKKCKAVTGSFLGRQSYFILMLNSSNWFIFPDTCNCHGTDILTIDHHPDFYDGALLEHPILKGDYTFNAPTGVAGVADGLHPKGFFTKPGKFWSIYDFQMIRYSLMVFHWENDLIFKYLHTIRESCKLLLNTIFIVLIRNCI